MTDRQKLDEAISILRTIHQDAQMALNDDWDRSDDGFESQQILIENFFEKIGELVVDTKEESE